MKKLFVISLVLGASFLLATVASAEITGSRHDLSAMNANNPDNQLCIFCHTPHHADLTVGDDAPLWNHTLSVATYTLYSSTTMDAVTGQPDGVSKLCLSCHDGTVAVSSFGGMTGSGTIGNAGDLGTDLSNDHPISFIYDTALSALDGELNDPATHLTGLGGTIATDWLFTGGLLECASCHDVHNQDNNAAMLHIDNAGSALCLTCHAK